MGGWGRSWAKVLALHPELVEVVACVDVEPPMLVVDYRGSWVSTAAQTTWDGEW